MCFSSLLKISVLAAALGVWASGQAPPAKDAAAETRGIPPRATPADYQFQAKAGNVTIAAEFKGHSVPTSEGTLNSEDYVVIETALFGPPDTKLKLSIGDFTLRINGKKNVLPCQPYGLVAGSVKDPEWEPPASSSSKSKTSLGGGGKDANEPPPSPPPVPIEVRRAMAQHVQKASFPEGERVLPEAGLIYFQYRGKTSGIHSIELMYAGPAGKATLALQP
jgi:hypothetical protein